MDRFTIKIVWIRTLKAEQYFDDISAISQEKSNFDAELYLLRKLINAQESIFILLIVKQTD